MPLSFMRGLYQKKIYARDSSSADSNGVDGEHDWNQMQIPRNESVVSSEKTNADAVVGGIVFGFCVRERLVPSSEITACGFSMGIRRWALRNESVLCRIRRIRRCAADCETALAGQILWRTWSK